MKKGCADKSQDESVDRHGYALGDCLEDNQGVLNGGKTESGGHHVDHGVDWFVKLGIVKNHQFDSVEFDKFFN